MKNLTTEEQAIRVDNARAVLKAAGYFVDNLWHIEDVQATFDCSPIEAMFVLNRALTNSHIVGQIWSAIEIEGDFTAGLTRKEQ